MKHFNKKTTIFIAAIAVICTGCSFDVNSNIPQPQVQEMELLIASQSAAINTLIAENARLAQMLASFTVPFPQQIQAFDWHPDL